MSISNTKHSSRGRGKNQTVDEYMSGLEHPHKDGVEALRQAILSADALAKRDAVVLVVREWIARI